MGMSRKEFVLTVTEQLKENPRAVLAGHGIQAAVLQTIVKRPDVMAKLATVLWSTKFAKKGASGLKKQATFKISGYKNFADFNLNAREDVEKFIGGLPAEDMTTFNNSENIVTIILLPDTFTDGDDTTAQEIVTGKSVAVSFDSAVKKEYKVNGGMYLTIMFGDSIIRTAEETIAKSKEKTNKVKQARRTPAKIMGELKAKANKKLALLKKKRDDLEETAYNTSKELEQFGEFGTEFGNAGGNPINTKGLMNKRDAIVAAAKEAAAGLDPEGNKLFKDAVKLARAGGNTRLVSALLKEIDDPAITAYIQAGAPLDSSSVITGRKKKLKAAILELTKKNEQLLVDLALAPENKKLSIKSMISKNNSKIKELRAKLGTYKNLSVTAMKNKAVLLKEVNAEIEANIAKGATISQALNASLAKFITNPEQAQIIKQQVIQQVANGMPMQFAAQQAIQQNYTGNDDISLAGSQSIQDILASI